jgi:CheY-like chemotaxis protein
LTRSDPRACVPTEPHRQTLPGLEKGQNVGRFDAASGSRFRGPAISFGGLGAPLERLVVHRIGGAMSPGDRVLSGLHVLLVDDDQVVRRVLADGMRRGGLVVDEAGDGQEAFMRLKACPPDVIVTDLQMPILDGKELCRRLKGDPATRDIPIIVITGSSLDERDAVALGCDRLITKPVTAGALTAIVNALVDRVDEG